MLTLFAFIVVIGMVIDSAIVVLENITRHREQGESRREGAVYGASEVAMAITASTLTTLAILFPILFVRGIVQVLLTPFAVMAGIILLASLFTAITLTPMLSSRLLPEDFTGSGRQNRFFRLTEGTFKRVENAYSSLLGWALGHRAGVVTGAVILLVGSLAIVPLIGWQFMEAEDQAMIMGTIELPVGTRSEATEEAMADIHRILLEEIPGEHLQTVFYLAGGGGGLGGAEGSHAGRFGARVVTKDHRDWDIFEMGVRLRERIRELEGIHSIEHFTVDIQDAMSGMISTDMPLSVNIFGDDMDVTDQLAAEIEAIAREIPGAVNISISRERASPELWANIDRERASSIGLNVSAIADAVRTSIYGRTASRYYVAGDEYDIHVRLRAEDRAQPEDLGQLPLRLPSGELIRLENVAELTFEKGPVSIERRDQQRIVRVEGDVAGRSVGEVTSDIRRAIADIEAPDGVTVQIGGEFEEIKDAFFWLTLAIIIGMILVYMVMASQFESLLHPFVVMFSLPFAFIGVAWSLFIFGHNLTIIVFLGMLLLVGIVVNNAIILVDYINILRARGYAMTEAVREAGRVRLRPALMTALTTCFALLPMAFRKSHGDETWNPLGATILGGLLFATLITLVFIPVMYSILESRVKFSETGEEV